MKPWIILISVMLLFGVVWAANELELPTIQLRLAPAGVPVVQQLLAESLPQPVITVEQSLKPNPLDTITLPAEVLLHDIFVD
jgi:hypothetical protein